MYQTLISVADLYDHHQNNDCLIVDCRFSLADTSIKRQDYLQEHIPGAVYAHLDDDLSGEIIAGKTGRHPLPTVEEAVQLFSSWGIRPETQVVAYDDMSGAIAARLWWMLRWLGHERVAVLDQGWQAWKAAGYPLESGETRREPSVFIPEVQPQLLVNVMEVENREQTTVLVDSRTPERYQGISEPIDPVAGHIPGAINYPHPSNVNEKGEWHSAETLRTQLVASGAFAPEQKAIFYCGSGVTACRNILAYKQAGLGDALLYPGSWSEWITNESRAIG